jgi:hypothetical protein
MDEKELGGWLGKLMQSPYYSYMDYPRISDLAPVIEGDDITVTRRVEEMPDTFWDQPGLDKLDMNLDMDTVTEMATKLMRDIDKKTMKSAAEKLLVKKNLTLAETMDLLSRGLKPYFYDLMENNMIELTLATEDQRGKSDIHWLAPKIAEKIQERYAEIARLADEKRKALLDYDAKIEELESRIELIIKNGTDLII